MGALTHNGEVLQSLPANASQINFDNTGTNLNSTQTENAIKEVNTKVNTNTADINQLKSGLTGLIAEVVTSEPVAASGSVTVQYPSGFSYSNTAVVSVYITDGNVKYVGDEFAKATLTGSSIAMQNKMTTAAYVVGVVLAKVS